MTREHQHRKDRVSNSQTRWFVGMMLTLFSVIALSLSGVAGISRAVATWHEVQETGVPGYVSLRSDQAAPYWSDLSPGEQVNWQIEVTLQDAESSTLDLELRSQGELVHAGQMMTSVSACNTEFEKTGELNTPLCPEQSVNVLSETRLSDIAHPDQGQVFRLARLDADTPRYILVTLGISPSADPRAIADTSMNLGVGLHASGATTSVEHRKPQPTLPATGVDIAILVLLAVGLTTIMLGTYLMKSAREGHE